MRLGVALSQADTWHFFQDLYEDFTSKYDVEVFRYQPTKFPFSHERINKWNFRKKLREFLRSQDIVFFEWASGLLAAATQLPKECKIVTRLHRYEIFDWASKINWENVDKVILVSHAMLKKFAEKFPEHKHKCIVIPVGISTTKFHPDTRIFNGDIGILCHLAPRKRIYDLILSFYDLCQIRKDFHLHIAGGSDPVNMDYVDAMQTLIRRLALQNKVTFYGNVTETWQWYRNIDIFITNSYSEGMQVAPMEAMASGCYCLSHRWDGAEELLPEDNLYFSSADLIDKILRYSDMHGQLKQIEKERMRTIACEKFDVEKTKTQIRHVIDAMG